MKSNVPTATNNVRLAIIGTGGMAIGHANAFKNIRGCKLVAAVDIDYPKAQQFAQQHNIPYTFSSVSELLAADIVDAVTIVTPDAFHMSVALPCLKAGKHVLCEKPLAMNYPDARKMLTAARKAGVIHMVNFSYRNWPCIQEVAKLVQSGKIGDIRYVDASYLQAWLVSNAWGDWRTSPTWLWRLSSEHGSKGVLGDIGVHIVDFAMFPVGPIRSVNCKLKTYSKADGQRIGPYNLDANDSAAIMVEFANGVLGTINTSRWVSGHTNRLFLKISGTLGSVEINSDVTTGGYRICTGEDIHTATWRDVTAKPTQTNYQRFIKAIRTGISPQPDFARGAEVQKVLDACFQSNATDQTIKI